MIRALVCVPPMCPLNRPYAAVPYLAGQLRAMGAEVRAWDASLDLVLRLYSAPVLRTLFAVVRAQGVPPAYAEMVANASRYGQVIGPLIRFLQGRESGLAQRIVRQAWLPQGPRFATCDAEAERLAFGVYGIDDQARWLATLLVQDLADCWRLTIAPHFGLTSYASQLTAGAQDFAPIAAHLAEAPDPIEAELLVLAAQRIPEECQLVVLSCPFPGNVVAAFRLAQWLRRARPACRIALGGGFPSTELRDLSDPSVFDWVDWVCLDDATAPLQAILATLAGAGVPVPRSFTRRAGTVVFERAQPVSTDFRAHATPSYIDLPLDDYLDLVDRWNPAQRLWNEGRWLALTAAQGCYWRRCTFCDTTLPYIADYRPQRAVALADRMDALHAETGRSGFHFTDEAAPPAVLLGLALELLARGRSYHWWGNIRFDDYFTADRCRLLAAAGCIAVTGGLEVAHDRLLARIDKGVSVAQGARVCRAFAAAGVLVHAYLMYGFPSQNAQDTIDSCEIVRQLFAAGCLQSAFWHRFTATAHSPIGRDPAAFGIRIVGPPTGGFARNNLLHVDLDGSDHDRFAAGLVEALEHWLLEEGLDDPVQSWFDGSVPAPSVPADLIAGHLAVEQPPTGARLCWIGGPVWTVAHGLSLIDECGELLEFTVDTSRAAQMDRLCARARPGNALPLVVEEDPLLQGVLHPAGLLRI